MALHTIRSETESCQKEYVDRAKNRYRQKRIDNWNHASPQHGNPRRIGAYYHKLLQHYYRFLVPPGLRVLELGCGHGDLLASLNPSLGVGVDFSNEMIQSASVKHPHLFFILNDAHDIVFKERFDIIILSHVLEHFDDPGDIISQIKKVSKRWIIVACPNPIRFKVLVKHALFRRNYSNLGHVYSWDRSHLTNFLEFHNDEIFQH